MCVLSRQANMQIMEGLKELKAILLTLRSSPPTLQADSTAFSFIEDYCEEMTLYAESVYAESVKADDTLVERINTLRIKPDTSNLARQETSLSKDPSRRLPAPVAMVETSQTVQESAENRPQLQQRSPGALSRLHTPSVSICSCR